MVWVAARGFRRTADQSAYPTAFQHGMQSLLPALIACVLQGGDFIAQGAFPDKGQPPGLVIGAEGVELLQRLLHGIN